MGESWSAQDLLSAGWLEADLEWEHKSERIVEALAQQDFAKAKDAASVALQLARADFTSSDPRLGTSLANFGICLSRAGDSDVGALFRQALEVWRSSDDWIARMDAPRVARSSLFHMRMELQHRDTYRARWQQRWEEMAAVAIARLEALNSTQALANVSAAEVLARWRRERPAMLNDTRKLMAACFLLLAPAAD